MQFDVFINPVVRARTAFPLVTLMQSDRADTGSVRMVAFLAPSIDFPSSQRLSPIVEINGKNYFLIFPSITNLQARDLKHPIANISTHRDKIVAGIDWLFTGV